MRKRDFFHLEFDIAIDQIIIKDATCLQEISVCIQRLECLRQAGTYRWDVFHFLGRQVIKILVQGRARINLVMIPSIPAIIMAANIR